MPQAPSARGVLDFGGRAFVTAMHKDLTPASSIVPCSIPDLADHVPAGALHFFYVLDVSSFQNYYAVMNSSYVRSAPVVCVPFL